GTRECEVLRRADKMAVKFDDGGRRVVTPIQLDGSGGRALYQGSGRSSTQQHRPDRNEIHCKGGRSVSVLPLSGDRKGPGVGERAERTRGGRRNMGADQSAVHGGHAAAREAAHADSAKEDGSGAEKICSGEIKVL